ncbi:cytochrome P450 [Lactifluus volemus]|nr:cytochrome P450 [Lactifluus volemus]
MRQMVIPPQHFFIAAARFVLLIALSLFGILATYVLFTIMQRRIRALRSPLRSLPGPKTTHWLRGNFADVAEPDSTRLQEEWVNTYGHVMKFYSAFLTPKLLAVDPVAISYVLQNSDSFRKTEFLKFSLGALMGNGLLFVEGPQHKKQVCSYIPVRATLMILNLQRKVMNPAFGPVQVRKFTSLFMEKSIELREIWADLISKSSRKDGRLRLDAYTWLNKVTLDIIGLAGFNYTFDSLHSGDETKNPMYTAFRSIVMANARNLVFIIQFAFPLFRSIPTARSRTLDRAFGEMRHIGSQLIEERKAAVLAERSASGSSVVEKQDVQGHDLLSLLVKSNIAADIPESMRMSDSEILSQVPTFLLAGHETSSTAVAWTLFALSCHSVVQGRLRAELRTCPTDSPTMEQLNSLPYLEGVVRESLRLYAPVSFTQRVANHDVVIPLQKPFTDKNGVLQNTVRLAKGDFVVIPIRLLNQSTELWGEDANEFRPERWESLPETVQGIPSVYGHLSTFIAGPYGCIGYRFSVAEIKALIFTLVRAFEFELALSPDDIVRRSGIVGRPTVASNPTAGPQMPLIIRPANMD